MSESSPDLDLVLFGATGFTGGLTADYLARHAPASLRWAIAGRSPARLEKVRDRLAGIDPGLEAMELIVADSSDRAALADVVRRTRLVASTVGPYLQYGGPLVAACAEAGTDYADLTGEPEFVDRTYLDHHETAVGSGARLVHACGFDSIPHDLGVFHLMQELQPVGPATVRGVVRAGGMFSGGTFHSALGAFARGRQMQSAFRDRVRREPRPAGRSSRAVLGRPHRDSDLGLWLVPAPTIDPQVVARSGAALPAYGPRFRYSHYAGLRTLRMAVGGVAGMTALFGAAQVPPLRRRLLERVPPGAGPDPARRERSWFSVDFIGAADGRTAHTRVSGGDPYTASAMMLGVSALCLLFDDNPRTSGQVTTAVAMGERLLDRLRAGGLTFERIA